ncbi:MAG: hypothetical protein E7168_05370 [Firmicutes bacterium]|nr:hypothetical protein [Bacillota bacterium]
MNKIDVFKNEYEYIKNIELVDDFKKLVDGLPDYFFTVAASSTGKYHPKFASGGGGLVRHTKVAVRFAYDLLSNPCIGDKYTSKEKDMMIIALTLHDGLKHGNPEEKYTKADHPLLICDHIRNESNNLTSLKEEDIEFICDVISSHMGPWNTDYYTKEEILPKPKNKYQNFVHMCDYLASRKFVNVEFDLENRITD